MVPFYYKRGLVRRPGSDNGHYANLVGRGRAGVTLMPMNNPTLPPVDYLFSPSPK
jgi:hypothetical protein